jgi:hypothetical protein
MKLAPPLPLLPILFLLLGATTPPAIFVFPQPNPLPGNPIVLLSNADPAIIARNQLITQGYWVIAFDGPPKDLLDLLPKLSGTSGYPSPPGPLALITTNPKHALTLLAPDSPTLTDPRIVAWVFVEPPSLKGHPITADSLAPATRPTLELRRTRPPSPTTLPAGLYELLPPGQVTRITFDKWNPNHTHSLLHAFLAAYLRNDPTARDEWISGSAIAPHASNARIESR